MGRSARLGAGLGLCAVVLAGCSTGPALPPTPPPRPNDLLVIGSFNFPESVLLAELYGQALAPGIEVRQAADLGPRELVQPALEQGLIDIVPEYAGTALAYLTGEETSATPDEAETHRLLVAALDPLGLAALDASPAQDANAVAVSADAFPGLVTVSDLAALTTPLRFGGPPECPKRPFCLPGLEREYGLHVESFLPLDAGGPLTTAYLTSFRVDAAVLFTTDPNVGPLHLVLLRDDQLLQPAENITPVGRADALARFPSAVPILNAVSATLTTEALSCLNGRLASGEPPADVAGAWLADRGAGPCGPGGWASVGSALGGEAG